MKRRVHRPLSQPPDNPLEAAYEAAADARDIVRDEQRRRELRSYSGDEEEVTANVHVTVNVPQVAPSQPDLKMETEVEVHGIRVKGLPRWAIALLALIGAGVTAGVSAWLAR